MENPYQSPPGESSEPASVNVYIATFSVCMLVAFVSFLMTNLQVLPFPVGAVFSIVSFFVGMLLAFHAAFAISTAGRRGTAFRSRFGYLVVSTQMLSDHGTEYQRAIQEFREGKSIVHQGIIFQLAADTKQPTEWKAAIGIAKPSEELAQRAERYVGEVVGFMRDESPEIFELTAGRLLRVCFLDSYERPYQYVGMIFDGQLTWSQKGSDVTD